MWTKSVSMMDVVSIERAEVKGMEVVLSGVL